MSETAPYNPFADLGIEVEPLIREALGGPPMFHDLSTDYTSLTRLLEFLGQRYFSGVVSIRFFDFDAHVLLYRGRPYHASSFHGARALAQEEALRKILDDARTAEGWIAVHALPDEMFPEEWELLDPLASPALPTRDASPTPWRVETPESPAPSGEGRPPVAASAPPIAMPTAETQTVAEVPTISSDGIDAVAAAVEITQANASGVVPSVADAEVLSREAGVEAAEAAGESASASTLAEVTAEAGGEAESTVEREDDAGAVPSGTAPIGSPEAWARLIEHMHARFRKIKGRALAGRLERELNDKLLPGGLRLYGGRVRGDLTQPVPALVIAARHCFAVLQHLGGTGFAEKALESGLHEIGVIDAALYRETVGAPTAS